MTLNSSQWAGEFTVPDTKHDNKTVTVCRMISPQYNKDRYSRSESTQRYLLT